MDSTFYVQSGHRNIFTTVTANSTTVAHWIRRVNIAFRSKRIAIFGLDIEWKPIQRRNAPENRTAILQICVGHRCIIIQLLHLDRIPPSLRRFLTNPRYKFAGVDIGNDINRLEHHHRLTCANLYDLRMEALEISPERLSRWPGLKELAREVAGIHLEKPMYLTLSDWEEEVLSEQQVAYACLDAYASCRIGIILLFNYQWS